MLWKNKLWFYVVSIACAIAILSTYFGLSSSTSFLVVVSESMEPTLNTGDIVIIGQSNNYYSSFKEVKVGDIIAFEAPAMTESGRNEIIVHRVMQIASSPFGDTIITTKGDANPYPIKSVDFPITNDDYVGRVDYIIPYIGLVLIYVDMLLRVAFPPLLFILIAVAAGVIIIMKVSRRRGILI
jgi:signal peptidase I